MKKNKRNTRWGRQKSSVHWSCCVKYERGARGGTVRLVLFSAIGAMCFTQASAEKPSIFELLDKLEEIHIAHFVGEQICESLYGDSGPPKGAPTDARKICSTANHPILWLMEHEPVWWKQHEPEIARTLEEHIRREAHRRIEDNRREWCKFRPKSVFQFPGHCRARRIPHFVTLSKSHSEKTF